MAPPTSRVTPRTGLPCLPTCYGGGPRHTALVIMRRRTITPLTDDVATIETYGALDPRHAVLEQLAEAIGRHTAARSAHERRSDSVVTDGITHR
jgi:hypothetical protein